MNAFDSFAVCSSKNKDSALQRSIISRVVRGCRDGKMTYSSIPDMLTLCCALKRCLSHSSEAPQAANVLLAIFKSAEKLLQCPSFLLRRLLRPSESETDVTSTARPSQHRRQQQSVAPSTRPAAGTGHLSELSKSQSRGCSKSREQDGIEVHCSCLQGSLLATTACARQHW